jgi:hypothetical protein
VEVDHVAGFVHVRTDPYREELLVKNFFNTLENLALNKT